MNYQIFRYTLKCKCGFTRTYNRDFKDKKSLDNICPVCNGKLVESGKDKGIGTLKNKVKEN